MDRDNGPYANDEDEERRKPDDLQAENSQADKVATDVPETSIVLRSQTSEYIQFDLIGDVDLLAAPEVWVVVSRELDEQAQTRAVLLDFSAAEYLDSAGLGMLVHLERHARKQGRRLYLMHINSAIQRLLTITRLNPILAVASDLEQVLHVLQENQEDHTKRTEATIEANKEIA